MIRRPPRSTLSSSSAASDVYKRQLQIVPLLAGHPELITLGLGTDALQAQDLDELVDLLGMVRGDAGLDGQALASRATGRLFDLADVERLEGDLAPYQLLLEHLVEGA